MKHQNIKCDENPFGESQSSKGHDKLWTESHHRCLNIQRVSKRMTRFQIIISNNENVLQLQNKLQTIKSSSFTPHNYKCSMCPPPAARTTSKR